MAKHHPKNERIKRKYLIYLEEAKRMSAGSVDDVAAAIALFERSTNYKDFAAFHIEQARKFKRDLNEATNPKTGKPLAKATIRARLNAVKSFMHYLAGQQGYKYKISYSDCDYFNLSANDTRIATTKRERPVPNLEQIRHTITSMPSNTTIQKRDRAIMAFAILSGARDDAIASFDVGHVDLSKRTIFHDARKVRAKNRKTVTTTFFPVGDDIEAVVADWIIYLKTKHHFGDDEPLFPSTKIDLDHNQQFAAVGLTRQHWKNADAIRRIFKQSFQAAGLPYFNPHSFRKTLARMGEKMCTTPEALISWSQNLSHENLLTTLTAYGKVSNHRQTEIMNLMTTTNDPKFSGAPDAETIAWVMDHVSDRMRNA